jgi:hypothetical protein
MSRRKLRPLVAAGFAAVAAFATAAPASAGVLVDNAPDCANADGTAVFAPWGDSANYFLGHNGGFENGSSGWSLNGSASVTNDNESYAVSGAGSSSLRLPNGSSAVSPEECVGLENPTVRFFVKKNSGGLMSSLRIDATVETSLGVDVVVPVGAVSASGSWSASPVELVVANLLPLLPGSYTPTQFTFTPQGGSWQVDDLYVDPWGWKP